MSVGEIFKLLPICLVILIPLSVVFTISTFHEELDKSILSRNNLAYFGLTYAVITIIAILVFGAYGGFVWMMSVLI